MKKVMVELKKGATIDGVRRSAGWSGEVEPGVAAQLRVTGKLAEAARPAKAPAPKAKAEA